MTTWLASYPRSGNTFFRVLLHRVYGISTGSIYAEDPPTEMAEVLGSNGRRSARQGDCFGRELFVKTHELPGPDDYPAIYLIRDGRDALVSYAKFILNYEHQREFERDAFLDTLRALVIGDASFGGWGTNVAKWVRRPNTALVLFERLVQDPLYEAERALRSIGHEVPSAKNAPPTFEELHTVLPRFFTTGRVGNWRLDMPQELQEFFWHKHGSLMAELGYERGVDLEAVARA